MRNKYFLIISGIMLVAILLYRLFERTRQADFGLMGKYKFSITDTSLFKMTYLAFDSYGYLITKSPVQGMAIDRFDFFIQDYDLIVSVKHPITAVYIQSKAVENETGNFNSLKNPVEIIQDTAISYPDHVYIYFLKPKSKYRLLLP